MPKNKIVYYPNNTYNIAKEIEEIKTTQIYILKNEIKMQEDLRKLEEYQVAIKEKQKVMKQDIVDIKQEQKVMKQDILDIKQEQKEMRKDIKNLDKKLDDSVKEIGEMFFEFTKRLDEKLDKK